ncbi:hypothetical protein ANN_21657 [Periplaneta americana]|uniref:Reverse transcriptase domain-containing protein n=1 Tax=Periplaneta americana TaxID=6978 RepID=A0ABQ8S6E1_PERAM|nr:hypothetical protein ANN_21657 [Periplaneta americana]
MLAGNEFQSLGRAIVKEDEYEDVRWDGIVSIVSWRERVFRLWWEERSFRPVYMNLCSLQLMKLKANEIMDEFRCAMCSNFSGCGALSHHTRKAVSMKLINRKVKKEARKIVYYSLALDDITDTAKLEIFIRAIDQDASTGTTTDCSFHAKYLVRPLPKVTQPTTPSDYRPISILPTLSKVLERIVHRQLTDYLDSYNLLDPLQSGFRPNHSTSTALLKITEDAREPMDRREVTVLSLVDFSRAFETIDIDILIAKLKMLHLSDTAIMWTFAIAINVCLTIIGFLLDET